MVPEFQFSSLTLNVSLLYAQQFFQSRLDKKTVTNFILILKILMSHLNSKFNVALCINGYSNTRMISVKNVSE